MYMQLQCLWDRGDRPRALSSMQDFVQELSRRPKPDDATEAKTISSILARCHRKQGNWQVELGGGLTLVPICSQHPAMYDG